MKTDIKRTLEVNKHQKEFYNNVHKIKRNLPSRLWANLRNNLLTKYREQYGIKNRVYDIHKIWLGDISSKKVLDLGCFKGNALSVYMAKNAKEYIGIDLSDNAIRHLNQKLTNENCKKAKGIAVDFLSDSFIEKDFDIIYAFSVLHHFEDFDLLVFKLKEKLKPDGFIISYDPMETSLPIKTLRAIYRPFQDTKDWEWPFSRSTLKKINSNFEIEEMRGILGRSKYGIPLSLLPVGGSFKKNFITRMIEKDWNISSLEQAYKCMQITMKLRIRPSSLQGKRI